LGRTQAEMGPRIVAAQIAGGGMDAPPPAAVACLHHNLGTVGVSLQGRVDGADHEPMAPFRSDIAIQAGWAGYGGHEQVQAAVVVDVPVSQTAAHRGGAAERSV